MSKVTADFLDLIDKLEAEHAKQGDYIQRLKLSVGLRQFLDMPVNKAARFTIEGQVPPLRNVHYLRGIPHLKVTELDGTLIIRTPLRDVPPKLWPLPTPQQP